MDHWLNTIQIVSGAYLINILVHLVVSLKMLFPLLLHLLWILEILSDEFDQSIRILIDSVYPFPQTIDICIEPDILLTHQLHRVLTLLIEHLFQLFLQCFEIIFNSNKQWLFLLMNDSQQFVLLIRLDMSQILMDLSVLRVFIHHWLQRFNIIRLDLLQRQQIGEV